MPESLEHKALKACALRIFDGNVEKMVDDRVDVKTHQPSSTVSQHFNLDREMVDKTLEFVPGEWLLASYIATGISNVPIFIKAEDSEEVIEKFLKKR